MAADNRGIMGRQEAVCRGLMRNVSVVCWGRKWVPGIIRADEAEYGVGCGWELIQQPGWVGGREGVNITVGVGWGLALQPGWASGCGVGVEGWMGGG